MAAQVPDGVSSAIGASPTTQPEAGKATTTSTSTTTASDHKDGAKPSVLIIGGLGYCGRFLALYIHNNNLASEVRIVDKQLPELAWLAPEFSEACSRSLFIQADASRKGK